MSEVDFVFAGGGTGGHLYPGLAVAAALRQRDADVGITFMTTQRELDTKLLAETPFAQVRQLVRPFTVHPLHVLSFWRSWRASVRAARRFLNEHRPRAVLGLGGYAAGPAVVAARKLGLPIAILNPDAIPGRANRYLARRVDLVVLQWDVSRRLLSDGVECQTLGCPIRAEFAGADGAAGRRRFELDAQRPVVLVTGASQGAHTVNQAFTRVWPEYYREHPEWQVLHLSGPGDEQEVRAAYDAANVPARVVSFTHEMWLAVAAADVVVARAGASTLAELTVLGKPSILLPYPYHRDRHQHANARVLVECGAAIIVEDQRSAKLNAPALLSALRRVTSADERGRMSEASKSLGRSRAAEDVASWLAERGLRAPRNK